MNLRFADNNLDVEPRAYLRRLSGRDDYLHAHARMASANRCAGGGRDVCAEAVGGRDPHDAVELLLTGGVECQFVHRGLDALGRAEGLSAQVGQLPAAGRADQYTAAEALLERGDAARNGGVVEAQVVGGGVEAAGATDREKHQ